jgi:AraC family transcriptional regulator, regulatory protein of adaptative response / DNA-3-methyladenine glycosylase II
VLLETTLRPAPPYSLAQSARLASDATRFFRDGVFSAVLEADGAPALARARQCGDGSLAVRIEGEHPEPALERFRFMLSVDDSHAEFLRRFRDDPLVGPAIRAHPGRRPLRTATVTHALLKAVCGQLIQARAARLLEAKLLRRLCGGHEGLRLPPGRGTFAGLSPSALAPHGLVARKAGALVRVSRELDVERLRGVGSAAAVARLERERGLGPWSAGMVCLYGLGRFERGLVGDLGLIKLCSVLRGRRAEVEDTRELLEPYEEWAGLASIYLLASVPKTKWAGALALAG